MFVLAKTAQKNNKLGKRGVIYCERLKKYQAWITRNKERTYLGVFDSEEKAVEAYNNAEQLLTKGYKL